MTVASFLAVRRAAGNALSLLALSLAIIIVAAEPAYPHAAIIDSDPADGAVIAVPPVRVALDFNEPVSPLVLNLIRPGGARTALDTYELRDRTLEIRMPDDLKNGTHALAWRVTSSDGHPVGGSLLFSIGAPSAALAVADNVSDATIRMAIWLAKLGLYIGLFIGIGGAFALSSLFPHTRPGKCGVLAALSTGIGAAVGSIGLQGLDALGVGPMMLSDPNVWRTGLYSSLGTSSLVALTALFAATASLMMARPTGRIVSALALLGMGLSLVATGHASAAEPQWLTRPTVFLHGLGIAFWAGALLPLGVAIHQRTEDAAIGLARFSRTIPFLLAGLIICGLILATIQVERPEALLETSYGRILIVKLSLLSAVLAIAAFNRWKLSEQAAEEDSSGVRKLARSIMAETLIIVLILGVAATWRFTPPPRALAVVAAEPARLHIHTEALMADIEVSPGRTRPVEVRIFVLKGDFQLIEPQEITLVLSKPAAGIEPIHRPATRTEEAGWRVDPLVIPLEGVWNLGVDVLISDFEIVRLNGKVNVRP